MHEVAVFDLDDMFGVRRALEVLPECRWDDFFATWAVVAESNGLDTERMQQSATREARAARDDPRCSDDVATAWDTVSGAMRSYLDWKAAGDRAR